MLARIAGGWEIKDTQPTPRQKILPLGAIGRTYADGTLVIGDAAGLVKPTTGGGIHYSIVSAALAADVAVDALAKDRLGADALSGYERAWRAEAGGGIDAERGARAGVTGPSGTAPHSLFEL